MIDILSRSFTSRTENDQESQSIGHGHGNGQGRTSFRDYFRKRSSDCADHQHQEPSSGEPSSKRNTIGNGRRRHSTSDLARSNSNKPPSTRRSSAVALPRPPSIPSSIHQLVSVSENAQGEGEGEGGYESDRSSVVSEMTLMTYSDEKAGLIKEEFFRRMKEEGSEDLTMDEKEDVLRQIRVEQEEQFKRKIELERLKCSKCVRTQVQDGDKANENEDNEDSISSEKDEFFERLKELQQHLKKDGSVLLFSQQDGDEKGQEEKKKDKDAHAPERRGSNNNKASTSITRRRSSLASSFCSVRTTQQGNLRRRSSKLSDTMSTNVEEEEAMIDNDTSVIPKSDKKPIGGAKSKSLTSSYNPKSKKKSDGRNRDINQGECCKPVRRRSVSFNDTENKNENSSTHADISDIIELKLLVANQQATIDTLSSKLHNLELAKQRENSTLSNQLNDCREKEIICQNKELVRLRQVDCCFDALVRDHQQQQQKNELLEERNEDLMRENVNLQHQLNELKLSLGLGLVATGEGRRRCSNETPVTLASTEAVSVANTL